jgi:hypothetical protein
MAAPSPPLGEADPGDATRRRWRLIRELAVFSVKAGVEAVRDLVLIPVALVAGLWGLVFEREDPERPLRTMIGLGRRFDAWLNLFGDQPGHGIDDHLERLEAILVEQHRRGGITAQAKDRIDRALDAVQRPPAPKRPSSSDPGIPVDS